MFWKACTPPKKEQGMSLVIVLILLATTMILGVGAVQLSMMSERSARNDRDYQIAWQASEAALRDAESDIGGATSSRATLFSNDNAVSFVAGCSSSGNTKGLCLPSISGKPRLVERGFHHRQHPKRGTGQLHQQNF